MRRLPLRPPRFAGADAGIVSGELGVSAEVGSTAVGTVPDCVLAAFCFGGPAPDPMSFIGVECEIQAWDPDGAGCADLSCNPFAPQPNPACFVIGRIEDGRVDETAIGA